MDFVSSVAGSVLVMDDFYFTKKMKSNPQFGKMLDGREVWGWGVWMG